MAENIVNQRMCIRKVTNAEEREAVFRFRYRIYVEVMKRRQKYADHHKKTICEPLDEHGVIMAAFKGDDVIATLRSNFMSDPHTKYYHKLYRLSLFNDIPHDRITMTTKLMVAPEYRKTAIPLKVICHMPDAVHFPSGILFDIIDCNKPLIPFFSRYGWATYMNWAFHREYGTVMPMFVAVRDLEYLESINSPFLKIAKKHGVAHCINSARIRKALSLN